MNGPTLLRTTFSVHRFFYSFTSSDGSKGTIADRMVPPRSIMWHYGIRSKEGKHAREQNIDCFKQHRTPQCWLLTMVTYPANTTKRFSWLTRPAPIFLLLKNIEIYSYIAMLTPVRCPWPTRCGFPGYAGSQALTRQTLRSSRLQ